MICYQVIATPSHRVAMLRQRHRNMMTCCLVIATRLTGRGQQRSSPHLNGMGPISAMA
jgi:hypothetical protein